VLGSIQPSAFAQILIDDAPLNPQEIIAEVPIFGYRSFPKQALVALDPKNDKWAIDGTIFYDAAANDPDLLAKAGKKPSEIASMPFDKVVDLYKKFAFDSQCRTYENWSYCQTNRASNVVHVSNKGSRYYGDALDTDVVRLAFSNGTFQDSTTQFLPMSDASGKQAIGLTVDAGYAKVAKNVYWSLDKAAKASTDPSSAFDLSQATADASTKTAFTEAAAVLVTKIAIGKPLVFSAKEKGLQIEPSILRAYDVYWLQLAINPRQDLRGSISELSFFVYLKTQDAQTFDLVPLRFGHDVGTKEQSGNPEIKVEVGGAGVSVGKFYSQEVTFKSLKPTIVGTGLQAAEFGWSLSDDMVDMSAKRFIAIIGVPKHASKLELKMVVTAKTQAKWLVQGEAASGEPKVYATDLPRN
jgi:hypothetical protein